MTGDRDRGNLLTEQINPQSIDLDRLSPLELVDAIGAEDVKVAQAVALQRQEIARAIELTAKALQQGGRLLYVGAGTSGRLGVLDAAECPPTFQVPSELVQGAIAGGGWMRWFAVRRAKRMNGMREWPKLLRAILHLMMW